MKKPLRFLTVASVVGTLALGLGAVHSVHAFDEHEATIDYRQGVMRAIGGNVGSIAAVIVDGADFGENLEMHTKHLVDLTGDIPALFPEGSDFPDTDAREEIWDDWDRFQELAQDTKEAAEELHAAVEAGDDDELPIRFRNLGQSCQACHDDFRRD
ncbi:MULTISPECIES: cytochrome c [unclassified Thioalkalivibrio]|uniref:c-type cytochrome n=1 Tax=unclassified Thioalkalivibrio TaxID=2621013 RepID=UPI000381F34E|nr:MULTISPECIES: cytochrome c [unclassified Thioalkalivibrio]